MAQRHSIVTVIGRNKEVAKLAAAESFVLTEIALGDGDRYPAGGETELENELHRGVVTGSGVEAGEPNAVWFDLYVPANVATFHSQEIGLFDEDGVLYALSRYDAPVPKFGPDSTSLSDQTFRIVVVFSDTENIVVTLNPVAGITPDTLSGHLPWATDAEAKDLLQENRIIDPMRLHGSMADYFANNLVFPEIETATNVLAITDNADGMITIDAAQTWLWRGMVRYSSDDFVLADRTLVHAANKTYHLNWHPSGIGIAVPKATYPNGRFELIDMTAAAPVETDNNYDSTYDKMLIAKIVTDGANTPTITLLKNKAVMVIDLNFTSSALVASGANGATATFYPVWNFARTPTVQSSMWHMAIASSADADWYCITTGVTRYGATATAIRDYATTLSMQLVGGC